MDKMTKSEFRREACKAGINPNLYGVTINSGLWSKNMGQVFGGTVVGIVWFDEWKTKNEYHRELGEWDRTFLSKAPYVTLKKGKNLYYIEAIRIKEYLGKLLDDLLISMAKSGGKNKKHGQ